MCLTRRDGELINYRTRGLFEQLPAATKRRRGARASSGALYYTQTGECR